MKVTSFKDMETYIYSSVIVYLKGIQAPELGFPSPIQGENGETWQLGVSSEPVRREFRRNYQREQAEANANMQVKLFTGKGEYVVATYNPKQKWVKMYERPFKINNCVPLMGKLYDAFYTNTPFGKIIMELDAPRVAPFRHSRVRRGISGGQPMEETDAPYWDDNEGYGDDEV